MTVGIAAQESKIKHKVFSKEDGVVLNVIRGVAFDDDGFCGLVEVS